MTLNLRFAKIRLATGPQIHYAEQGDANGEPVVLLHGWPDSWFTFNRVLPLLPPRLRVVAPDQRGFGESERPVDGYTIDDFAADAVAFLDALAIEKATIVGHSFGSFVARRTAITRPDRVARLVLIGTGFTGGNAVTREVLESLTDLPDPVPADFARDFQRGTAYLPIPADFFERLIAESLKLPARLWRAVFEGIVAYEDSAELCRITAPTQLIWGDRDALFPHEDQNRLVAEIRGAALTVYTETGHCPNWERPERVAGDLIAEI
jgi:pimeloyl-ACP methyl ester carboxylesterase